MNATANLGMPGGPMAMLATPALPGPQSMSVAMMPPAVPETPGQFLDVMAALLDVPMQATQAPSSPGIGCPAQPETVSPKNDAFKSIFSGAPLTNIFSDVAADPQKPTAAHKSADANAAAPGQASPQENVAAMAMALPPPTHMVYDVARPALPAVNPGVRPAQPNPKAVTVARPQIGNQKNVAFELQLKTKTVEPPNPPAPEVASTRTPAGKDAPPPAPATPLTGAPQQAAQPQPRPQEKTMPLPREIATLPPQENATPQPQQRPMPQPQETATAQPRERETPQAGALDASAKPRGQADTHAETHTDTQEDPRRESDDTAPASAAVSGLDRAASILNDSSAPVPVATTRPADSVPVREPLHAAPAAQALRTSEPALPAAIAPRAAAQDISMRISRPEAPAVDIHLMQRAGDVHVSVRTMDTGLQVSLRQDLNSLVTSLNRAGYHAEAIASREAAQMNSQNGREESQSGSHNGRQWGGHEPSQDQGQRRGHTRRQWMELMENAQ